MFNEWGEAPRMTKNDGDDDWLEYWLEIDLILYLKNLEWSVNRDCFNFFD